MMRPFALPLFALVTLSACAADVPENVPERGTWEVAASLDSMTVDGMIIPPENFPPQLAALNETESQCGEPLFIDADWQQRDLSSRTGGQCTMEQYTFDDDSAEGSGRCDLSEGGMEFTPRFDVRVNFDATSYRMVVSMEGTTVLPEDDNPHSIRVIAVQEGTRTGDC